MCPGMEIYTISTYPYICKDVYIFNAGQFLLLSIFPISLKFHPDGIFRACANMRWLKYPRQKKMSGLQLRDSQSTSEDDHKTGFTDEGQTSYHHEQPFRFFFMAVAKGFSEFAHRI